jgi:HlyD family secretion protein
MKKNRLLIGMGVLLVLLIAGAIIAKKAGWIGSGNEAQVASEKPARRNIIEEVAASGKIHPLTELKLSSEVSGEVIELNVAEGDSVRKGKLLCVINPSIYEAIVSQSEASLSQLRAARSGAAAALANAKVQFEQAQLSFNRNKKLYEQKVLSDAEFENAELAFKNAGAARESAQEQYNAANFNVQGAEAALRQARDNLNKTRIYAPMSGIISLVNVKLGERVVGTAQMAGTELIRIADLDNMIAEVDVNESDVLRINTGDTAKVVIDAYIDREFPGIVSQVAYSSTTATQVVSTSTVTNFTVKIRLDRSGYADLLDATKGRRYPFRPGMSCSADILTNRSSNVLSVPIQSVTTREARELKGKDKSKKAETAADAEMKELVFIDSSGFAVPRLVSTGIQDASFIEIKSGLKGDEKVIYAPYKLVSKTLEPGDKVKSVAEKELFKEAVAEE